MRREERGRRRKGRSRRRREGIPPPFGDLIQGIEQAGNRKRMKEKGESRERSRLRRGKEKRGEGREKKEGGGRGYLPFLDWLI
jgi:hypothetical protein